MQFKDIKQSIGITFNIKGEPKRIFRMVTTTSTLLPRMMVLNVKANSVIPIENISDDTLVEVVKYQI